MRILLFFLILFFSNCQAQTIGLRTISHHFPNESTYNNQNYGIYYSDESVTFGYYKNTFRKDSFYIGRTFNKNQYSMFVGGITGYQKDNNPTGQKSGYQIMPIISFGYSFPIFGNLNGKFENVPSISKTTGLAPAVINFSFEYKLNGPFN